MNVGAIWRRSVIAMWQRRRLSGCRQQLSVREKSEPTLSAVEARSGHSKIAGDLGRSVAAFYEVAGAAALAVRDDPRATAKVLAGVASLGDRADYALARFRVRSDRVLP